MSKSNKKIAVSLSLLFFYAMLSLVAVGLEKEPGPVIILQPLILGPTQGLPVTLVMREDVLYTWGDSNFSGEIFSYFVYGIFSWFAGGWLLVFAGYGMVDKKPLGAALFLGAYWIVTGIINAVILALASI